MDLGTYDGKPVLGMRAALTNTGDGLSQALAIDPLPMHMGERVFVLCEAEVTGHTHEPIKNTNGVALVVKLKGETMTIVDAGFAEQHIDEQKEKNLLAREAEQGVSRLWKTALLAPVDEPDLVEAHAMGEHRDGLVDGCPECDAELQSVEVENLTTKPPRKRRSS